MFHKPACSLIYIGWLVLPWDGYLAWAGSKGGRWRPPLESLPCTKKGAPKLPSKGYYCNPVFADFALTALIAPVPSLSDVRLTQALPFWFPVSSSQDSSFGASVCLLLLLPAAASSSPHPWIMAIIHLFNQDSSSPGAYNLREENDTTGYWVWLC